MSSYFTTANSSIIKVLKQKVFIYKRSIYIESVVSSGIFVYLLVPLASYYIIILIGNHRVNKSVLLKEGGTNQLAIYYMEREEFISKLGLEILIACTGCGMASCGSKSNDPTPTPSQGTPPPAMGSGAVL